MCHVDYEKGEKRNDERNRKRQASELLEIKKITITLEYWHQKEKLSKEWPSRTRKHFETKP